MVLETKVSYTLLTYLRILMQVVWIETIPFMGIDNRSSSTIVENFKVGWTFFDSIIRVQTIDNKSGSFLLSGVIVCMQTKTPTKRGILSLNFVVIRSEYFQFSNPREKY